MIDDEIDFHDEFRNVTPLAWKWNDYAKRRNDFFREQRKKFLIGPEHILSIREFEKMEMFGWQCHPRKSGSIARLLLFLDPSLS